jgi:prevent-host-death family protein
MCWKGVAMQTYGIRELQRRSSEIVDELERTRRPALVTRHGKPVAVLSPIDVDALEDFILANAPEYVASMAEAEEDAREGRTRPLADIVAELEAADTA